MKTAAFIFIVAAAPAVAQVDTTAKSPKDSVYVLDEVKVVAQKPKMEAPLFNTLHQADLGKVATLTPGVTTVAPFSSEFRVHDLPWVGFYLDVRITGRTTQVLGAFTSFNSDLYDLELEKAFYPVKYGDNAIARLLRKDIDRIKPRVSLDLIQRSLTVPFKIDAAHSVIALRNIQVPGFMSKLIPDLKLIPQLLELSHRLDANIGKATLRTDVRVGFEDGDYSGRMLRYTNALRERAVSTLGVITFETPIRRSTLRANLGYERERLSYFRRSPGTVDSIEQMIDAVNFDLSLRNARAELGISARDHMLQLYTSGRYEATDDSTAYAVVEPSYGIFFSGAAGYVWGNTATVAVGNWEGKFGIHKRATRYPSRYIIDGNGLDSRIGGLMLSDNGALEFALKSRGFFNRYEILVYSKRFDIGQQEGYSRGIDFSAVRSSNPYIKILASFSRARIDGKRIPGSIPATLAGYFGYRMSPGINAVVEARWQKGVYYADRNIRNYPLNDAFYINTGLDLDFGNTSASLTTANVLAFFGRKNEVARFPDPFGGGVVSITTPPLFNVQIRHELSGLSSQTESSENRFWKRALVFGGAAASMLLTHQVYTNKDWWQKRVPFHFAYDGAYAANVDKAGHFVFGNFLTENSVHLYRWAGWDEGTANWLAFGTAAALLFLPEYLEGRAPYFGFDPWDYAAGVSGGLLNVGKHYFPFLQRVSLRWSFLPTRPLISGDAWNYKDQKFWAAVRVWGPLCVAAGVNYSSYQGAGHRQVWLSADIDWTHLLGESVLTRLANRVKFVFPAIRISPKAGLSWTSWD